MRLDLYDFLKNKLGCLGKMYLSRVPIVKTCDIFLVSSKSRSSIFWKLFDLHAKIFKEF